MNRVFFEIPFIILISQYVVYFSAGVVMSQMTEVYKLPITTLIYLIVVSVQDFHKILLIHVFPKVVLTRDFQIAVSTTFRAVVWVLDTLMVSKETFLVMTGGRDG